MRFDTASYWYHAIYVSLWVLIITGYITEIITPKTIQGSVLSFSFITIMLSYYTLYKSLNNTNVYKFWLGIAILQFAVCYRYKNSVYISVNNRLDLKPLQGFLIFLILYQL
jgi:hypothetical protein